LTTCPCCGFKFHGALTSGCKQCGARAVGEPLPKPAQELPSYGRALVLAVTGSLVALIFVVQVLVAFVQKWSGSFGFWSWAAAGETAAWRLKWIAIPSLFLVLWFGRKLYRSILSEPEKFCGFKYARRGLLSSAVVAMLIALLIGITVPARLEHRRWAQEAALRAQGYAIERALYEYQVKYKTYPAALKDLQQRIADPDGTLTAALADLDPSTYRPTSAVAANEPVKTRRMGGVDIRKASFSSATDDTPSGGFSFTNYSLPLPGEDKILGTEDDWIVWDGMVTKASDIAKGGVGRSVSASALEP
jgi:type II secretory pathway pseudopilin PulG